MKKGTPFFIHTFFHLKTAMIEVNDIGLKNYIFELKDASLRGKYDQVSKIKREL